MGFTSKTLVISFIAFVLIFFTSCSGSKDDPQPEKGRIIFYFTHYHEDEQLKFDTLTYTNAAGNQYMVNEIQYFISDVKLYDKDGNYQLIDKWKDIHYVDTDLPDTHIWEVYDPIEPGEYEKITFTFGISEEKNQSLMFVNAPERDMFWPEILGGGYHYMKLNGKWLAASQQILPFAFHLGIGQIYSGGVVHTDSITGFVQNHFEVELPNSSFTVTDGSYQHFEIRMNVENWFRNPHTYDHDAWGGDIMQKQDAMKIGCENGEVDVFSILNQIPLFPTAKK
jgi:hypothetical protein